MIKYDKDSVVGYFIANTKEITDKCFDNNLLLSIEVVEKFAKNKCKKLNALHLEKLGVKDYYNVYKITFTNYYFEKCGE